MKKPAPLHLETMGTGQPAGTLLVNIQDLPTHGGKDIVFNNGDVRTNIFVQKCGDRYHVFENRCPHAGTPLNMIGDKFLSLDGAYLLCRTHGALFDKTSGKCVGGPCKGDYLRSIAFEVREGGLYSL